MLLVVMLCLTHKTSDRLRGRAEACTLLVYIDDATSRLMQLHFVPTESSFAYFEATRAYLERHGKPVAFYSDKASVFRPTRDSVECGGRTVTQFGRVLYELNMNWSPKSGRHEVCYFDFLEDI